MKPRKSGTPLPNASNQAIVGVSAPSPMPTSRRQSQNHPFAHHDYDDSNAALPSQAGLQPIAPMNVNSRPGGTTANSQQVQGEQDYGETKKQSGFMRFITCGCFR